MDHPGADVHDLPPHGSQRCAARIVIHAYAGLDRQGEPTRVSVPLPSGGFTTSTDWAVQDSAGAAVPAQTRVLAQWPDGSVKWLLCHFRANTTRNQQAVYWLVPVAGGSGVGRPVSPAPRLHTERNLKTGELSLDTGPVQFTLAPRVSDLMHVTVGGRRSLLQPGIWIFDARGRQRWARYDSPQVIEEGPICTTVRLRGSFGRKSRLWFTARITFFANQGYVRIAVTLENPSRARHSGNYWDLGDPGSILFRELGLGLTRDNDAPLPGSVAWRERPDAATQEAAGHDFEIYQDSSGGENWRSRNHLNRRGEIPLQFQGYRLQSGADEARGLRASPIVYMQNDLGDFGVAPLEFWQKFPSAVTVNDYGLFWRPFPGQFGDLHELQAGEQSTHVAWFDFASPGSLDPCERLAWTHAPLEARCEPDTYADSGAIPYLPRAESPLRPECTQLLAEALEGPRNFFVKRETVDEYGWRHYGDTWADHEEVYYPGPHKPILSHYNNQFDILHGMLVEYLRSGDRRWWELADPLARHVMDIDIYHTDRDKAAYNGGLFWPTTHYYDAGTCTHRSMARQMRETGSTGVGGGPGSEHNFTSGLLLYYHLTGEEQARAAVIGLADWVIAMDDGEQHVLGLLSGRPTGVASLTNIPGYDGPGRGAANSIMALADGYLATGDAKYLDKADELIRRTIHPCDVIAERQLENKELRWSYTMHLQALMRYLELVSLPRTLSDKDEGCLRSREGIARYIKQSVLHYARWMVMHETLALDHPEKLEFPTETWAAQELRKGNVLLMAARLAEPAEAEPLARRGRYFLDRAWESFSSFATRDYTRPLALVLSQGYIEAALKSSTTPLPQFHIPNGPIEPSEPQEFVFQKEHIRRSMRSPLGLARMAVRSAAPARWHNILRQSWLKERIRHSCCCVRLSRRERP